MRDSHTIARLSETASAVVLSLILGLSGCGTHSTPEPAGTLQTPNLTGAWLFSETGSHSALAAGLSTKSGVLTGFATAYGCSNVPEQTIVNGTITSAGEVRLNTAKLNGGASLHLSGTLSTNGKSIDGTLAVVDGVCSTETVSNSIEGHVYAPAQGSYTGVFLGSDGVSTPVAAVLSQKTEPGPGGSYTLGGSVAFPNSPCLNTAAINSTESTVVGGVLSATYNAIVSGQQVTITATGTADPSAARITITGWAIHGGSCDGYSGTGMLTAS